MRPNWKTDKRKPKVREGRCSLTNCDRASGLSYYGYPLCDRCADYYLNERMPIDRLKTVLRISDKRLPQTETDNAPVDDLEEWETEVFQHERAEE